jgi:hypothetical protein
MNAARQDNRDRGGAMPRQDLGRHLTVEGDFEPQAATLLGPGGSEGGADERKRSSAGADRETEAPHSNLDDLKAQ